MNRIKNTKAFTLIELVVVIVILGILAAIAAFAYQNFIDNARQNATDRLADQVSKTIAASTTGATSNTAINASYASSVQATARSESGNNSVTVATQGAGLRCLAVSNNSKTSYIVYTANSITPGQIGKTYSTVNTTLCP